MKVVFVGPSLPDAPALATADIVVRPPARQGEVMRAVREGATVIGLIDGLFEWVAPVWHKELLFALSKGIPVLGAASMGALRAAECAAFGMIGVGRVFEDYMSGQRIDDADVALLHGPAELGYPAVTVPIVNIDATLAQACEQGTLSASESSFLAAAARAIFFKDRSWLRVAERAGVDWSRLCPIVEVARVDQKRQDALALLDAMADPKLAPLNVQDWQFQATPLWTRMYS